MTESDYNAFVKKLDPLIARGDYKSALAITRSALKHEPDDFFVRYQYAKMLGDWSDELSPARQKKLKAKAVSILRPLMRSLRGKPHAIRFRLPLNLYYQSQDWKGMYAFGCRFSRTDRQKGLYAQGLAATSLASDYRDQQNSLKSLSWAERAVGAWKAYDFADEKYYFPHYCFAKALALTGTPKTALSRLKIAARLSQRKTSDWEFADVLRLCS